MSSLRTVGGVALTVAVAAGVAMSAPAATAQPGPHAGVERADNRTGRQIVRLDPAADVAAFATALKGTGFAVVAAQSTLHTVVVKGPADGVAHLRSLPGVLGVAPDRTLKAQSLGFTPSSYSGSMTNVTKWTGAQNMWKAGYTGSGVDVAVIDTGVAPVASLSASDKVVVGPDLSFESQTTDARYLDSYGHGTAMASIIAGRETARSSGSTYAADTSNFYGMAPDARIISVKLSDRSGTVDVSQMIAAVDWVTYNRNRNGLNIRVLNLSYGSTSKLNAQDDPLSWAVETAWKKGVVVVASAGNDGGSQIGLASPAYNPWIVAVGANDTKGTATISDDTVASFSEYQATSGRPVDMLAPGVGVISASVPGGYLRTTYPGAVVGNGYMRGSGTSQAAAIVSGAFALVLQKLPGLRPDEAKRYVEASTSQIPNLPLAVQGKGMVFLGRIADNSMPVPYGYTYSKRVNGNGTGSLEAARGGRNITVGGTTISGEKDILGNAWSSSAMAAAAQNDTAWSADGRFNNGYWTGSGLVSDTTSWAGRTWQGRTWQGRTWQTSLWSGRTWQTGAWTGCAWSSSSWTGPVGKASWASAAWSSASWS